jgi:cytochrome c biogenesis protein CcmG/thiol:disulfide interchange protein DsbE
MTNKISKSTIMRALPAIIVFIFGVMFWYFLGNNDKSTPTALMGKKIPVFSLYTLANKPITNNQLLGEKYLLNVWATWCPSCDYELDYLKFLDKNGIKIVGVAYKDNTQKIINYLQQRGNPYKIIIFDKTGSLSVDLGVTGAPETFIVNSKGIISYRQTGLVTPEIWLKKLKPIFDAIK